MGRSWCIAVLLGVAFQGVAATALAEEPTSAVACATMPSNVQMPLALQLAVDQLLAQSSTLRRQCAAIAAAGPRTRLTIVVAPPDLRGCRARATFSWRASGALDVRIEVPFTYDFPELIAHELEHVVEQIEGLDLRQLAARQSTGVEEVAAGTFETRRARNAGRAAALEVETQSHLARVRRATVAAMAANRIPALVAE
ncbi:MAG: hypothetical protein ABI634_05515 [Acidobacteriota bacterium]